MPWDVDARQIVRIGAYTGRPAEPGLRELGGYRCNPKAPPEDPAEGCPGGWRTNRYTHSLIHYLRRRAEGGARVPNFELDTCGDPAIWAAVELYEHEQERCLKHIASIVNGRSGTA